MDPNDREFFSIANNMVEDQAQDYLDKRLAQLDLWVQQREASGAPADLRSLIDQVMNEPNLRGPVIVALCTALWRLRSIKEGTYGDKRRNL